MLDVHPVQGPVHGWREFFVHIVIVAIGLCLALALEELVSTIHHHYQVESARRALLQERVENRKRLMAEAREWRIRIAELQNNLLVLHYLQQHPGTPQQNLPGVLVWHSSGFGISDGVWNAAHVSGVVAMMPFEEIEKYNDLYGILRLEAQEGLDASSAVHDARRYDLSDPDPSHLNPEQLARIVDKVEEALSKQWFHGIEMANLVENFPDFGPGLTDEDLQRVRLKPDEQTMKTLSTARALTEARLKAAEPTAQPAVGSGAK